MFQRSLAHTHTHSGISHRLIGIQTQTSPCGLVQLGRTQALLERLQISPGNAFRSLRGERAGQGRRANQGVLMTLFLFPPLFNLGRGNQADCWSNLVTCSPSSRIQSDWCCASLPRSPRARHGPRPSPPPPLSRSLTRANVSGQCLVGVGAG